MTTTRIFKLKPWEPNEADVLGSILQALPYYRNVVWFSRMNSGAYALGEGKDKRYIKFGFPGCPDIMGMMTGGRLLCIEVKRPSGRLREAQAAFISKVSSQGGIAFVARSVDDLRTFLS